MRELRLVLAQILALADELGRRTIERQLAKSDRAAPRPWLDPLVGA